MVKPKQEWVVVTVNRYEGGLSVYGPFKWFFDASAFAEANEDDNWWIQHLTDPSRRKLPAAIC